VWSDCVPVTNFWEQCHWSSTMLLRLRSCKYIQSIQNAAACLITGVRQCEHIMPALHQLHWLPVCRWVDFKISTLVYRSLAGTAPVYLAGRCPLWSANNQTCLVKRSWPLFCHRRANAVEQSAWTAKATGHHFWTIQTIIENVYVWLVGLRRPMSER